MAKRSKQAASAPVSPAAPAPESTPAPAAPAASSVPKRGKKTAQPSPGAADAATDGLGGNFRDQALRLLAGDLTALDTSAAANAAGGVAGETDSDTDEGQPGGEALEAPAAGAEPVEGDDSHLADPGPAPAPAEGEGAEEGEGEGEDEDEGEPQPNAEGEGEPDLDALAELDDAALDAHAKAKGWPASFHKRVKKFAKQHRQAVAHEARLSERVAELEEQLEGRNAAPPGGGNQNGPAANGAVTLHEQGLLRDIELRKKALAQIDAHLSSPEGMAGRPLEVNGQSFSIAELRSESREFEWEVNQAKMQLQQLRQTNETNRRQFDAQAVTQHPWLKDQRNADTVAIQTALREFPLLAQIPRIRLILADHLAYQKQLAEAQARAKATANGNRQPGSNGQTRPPAPAARAPARPAAAPLPAARAETDGRAAVSQVMKTGTMADAVKALPFLIESRPK